MQSLTAPRAREPGLKDVPCRFVLVRSTIGPALECHTNPNSSSFPTWPCGRSHTPSPVPSCCSGCRTCRCGAGSPDTGAWCWPGTWRAGGIGYSSSRSAWSGWPATLSCCLLSQSLSLGPLKNREKRRYLIYQKCYWSESGEHYKLRWGFTGTTPVSLWNTSAPFYSVK